MTGAELVRTAPVRVVSLANGVLAVVQHRADVEVTAVAVAVAVGSRDEPAGRSGFAHLVEHLMFAGRSAQRPDGYGRRVEALGGRFNASTRADATHYVCVAPTAAHRDLLRLEAERFTRLVVDEADLHREVGVVTEEVAARFHRRPLPGFPTAHLRARMFRRFANRHDGASDTDGLAAASLDDVRGFFAAEYAPGRVTVVVVGNVDVDAAEDDLRATFGTLPTRPAAAPRALDEPVRGTGRHVVERSGGRTDAAALGYRTPDPADLDAYLPVVLLAEVLQARWSTRRPDGVLSHAVGVDLVGDPLGVRAPNGLVLRAAARPGSARTAADAGERLIADVARDRAPAGEVAAAAAVLSARLAAGWDDVAAQATWIADRLRCAGSVDLDDLLSGLAACSPDRVQAAAAALGEPCRVELVAPAQR